MILDWECAGNDEPGDQHADTGHTDPGCTSMFWSLGPDGDGWAVELIGVTAHGDYQPTAGVSLGTFDTEDDAKTAAQDHENKVG
jgi:hypothetical protein